MPFHVVESAAGGGAYGDVYRGDNGLGRPVAIKFIRPSVESDIAFVQDQARALSRVESPFVVHVITLFDVLDPERNVVAPAIIMEWIEGQTLGSVLRGARLTAAEARRIGEGVIDGLQAIHEAHITHNDLHLDNVLVGPDSGKIIDILYYSSLAARSGASQEAAYATDRRALRSLLYGILTHTNLDHADVDLFSRTLDANSTHAQIREAFMRATDTTLHIDLSSLVTYAYELLVDPAFVDSDAYADALEASTDAVTVKPLLLRMIETSIMTQKLARFTSRLWARTDRTERAEIGLALAAAIQRDVPNGTWWPHLFMLAAFGQSGWDSLNMIARLRLENAITDNILSGRVTAIGYDRRRTGQLGIWAKTFFPYFRDKAQVVKNLLTVLHMGWDGQNYVGEYFMSSLSQMATTPQEQQALIDALKRAHKNDARILIEHLDELPPQWKSQIVTQALPAFLVQAFGTPAPPPPPPPPPAASE